MENRIRQWVVAACGVALLAAGGCRNYLQDVDTTTTDYERTVKKQIILVEPQEKNETTGELRFKISEHVETEVKVFSVHNTLSRFTPYQGWRELYEIPVGLMIFPVGICSHILNVFSFGIFPYTWCWAMDCYGLACLNPIMNAESDSRYDDEPQRSRRELVDTKTESTTTLKSRTTVSLRAGESALHQRTDEAGVVGFVLLDLNGNGPTLQNGEREVRLFVGNARTPAEKWVVSRDLQHRLEEASEAIRHYRKAPTGKALFDCVSKLEKLKFVQLSYGLEQGELRRNAKNSAFIQEFKKAR